VDEERAQKRRSALRHVQFRRFFVGQSLSALGDRMPQVALSFAILDRGDSATAVGIVLGASTLSMIVFLLFGGVIADRFDRRRVMLACDGVRFVSQLVVAALLLGGRWTVWELVALQSIWGAAAAIFSPASTGLVPELVDEATLHGANSLQSVARSLSVVIGPALAGGLVATFSPGAAMAVDAASFAASSASLALVRLPARKPTGASRSMTRELVEGWRAFREHTWVWVVVAQFGLWSMLCYAPTIVLGAVVSKQRLGGAAAWGTVLAAFGVGSLAGAVVALRGTGRRPLLMGEVLMLGFALMPLGLVLPVSLPVVCLFAALGGIGFEFFGIVWTTALQRHIHPDLISRVSSYDWIGSIALLPIGYVGVGFVSDVIGARATLTCSTVAVVVLGCVALSVPQVRRLGQKPSKEDHPSPILRANA
jgi:MFS family permease